MTRRILATLLISVMLSTSVIPALAAGQTSPASTLPESLLTTDDIETITPSQGRSAGVSRIETAIEISRESGEPYDAVLIATSANYPDALAGAPLAHALGAPILLTGPSVLNAAVRTRLLEMKAAGTTKAYLLGGTGALSPAVQAGVEDIFGAADTTRIGGESRYETAALIAERLATLTEVTGAVLASGQSYPDALAAAGWAAFSGQAIVLTRRASLPAPSAAALASLGIVPDPEDGTAAPGLTLLVAGGPVAIEEQVVESYGSVVRIGGESRYETAALLAQHAWEWGMPSTSVGLATGRNFPDALAAGPWCAANGAPLLLVKAAELPAPAQGYLLTHASTVSHVQAFGGTGVVGETVVGAAVEAASVMMSRNAPVATDETDALLSQVTTDTLVFSATTDQLDSLAVGWVLRSNPTANAPEGYFRKILSIERPADGSVVLVTETAALTDVLLKGSVDMVMPAGEAQQPQVSAATRAESTLEAAAIGGGTAFDSRISFAFSPHHVFDGPAGSTVSFGADGALEFSQSFVVSIVVDGRWNEGALGIPYWAPYLVSYDQYLTYRGSFTLSVDVSGEIDIVKIPIGPQIPIAAEPLITGFLIKPEVQLYLKGSIGVELSLSSEFAVAETTTGIRYRDGQGWTTFESGPAESARPAYEPTLTGSGTLKLGIGAEVSVSICDFVGPYLDVTTLFARATLAADAATEGVSITLGVGSAIGGGLKADIPILGTNLVRVEIFEVEFVYFEWRFRFGGRTGEIAVVRSGRDLDEIWLVDAAGTSERKLVDVPGDVLATVTHIEWSPDGRILALNVFRGVGLTSGEYYRVETGEWVGPPPVPEGQSIHLGWMPDGTALVRGFGPDLGSGFEPVNLYRFSPETGGLQLVLEDPESGVYSPSPDGRYIAVAVSNQSQLRLYDMVNRTWRNAVTISNDLDAITSHLWAADSRTLYYTINHGSPFDEVWRYTLSDSRSESTQRSPGPLVDISSDGTRLLVEGHYYWDGSGSYQGLAVFDLTAGTVSRITPEPAWGTSYWPMGGEFSPDGSMVVYKVYDSSAGYSSNVWVTTSDGSQHVSIGEWFCPRWRPR